MDQTLPPEVTEAPTIEEAARHLGAALLLEGPAPIGATRRALGDPQFAKVLVATRKMPLVRDKLLSEPETAPVPSGGTLARKAAGSVLKWGMAGMKPAAPWVIERRLAACVACEHQTPAPNTLVYRGAKVAVGKDAMICTLCHCLTNTKAAISTEHCPGQDPDDPGLSRWGEPWVPPEDHPEGPW